MRTVVVRFAAAADGRQLLIDRDTTLSAVESVSSSALVSLDPGLTIAGVVTGVTSTDYLDSVIAALNCGTAGSLYIPVSQPLSKGDIIYLCRAGSGSIVLFFTDPS